MPRIYITYRPQDTGTDEVQQIVSQLGQAFGAENIHVTSANSEVDVLALYKEVQAYDALLVIMGLRWLDMQNPQGQRLIDDPYDYVYTEIYAALEKEEMWVSTLLVDSVQLPKPEQLPDTIQGLLRHDIIELDDWNTLPEQVEELRRRMAVIDASVPFEQQREKPVTIRQSAMVTIHPAEPQNNKGSTFSANEKEPESTWDQWVLAIFWIFMAILFFIHRTNAMMNPGN